MLTVAEPSLFMVGAAERIAIAEFMAAVSRPAIGTVPLSWRNVMPTLLACPEIVNVIQVVRGKGCIRAQHTVRVLGVPDTEQL